MSNVMTSVFIGLGSNLSDPVKQLTVAIESISQLEATEVIKCSQFYGSTPLGPEDQPDFVNAVCQIETALLPDALLTELQSIEKTQGRIKKRHWGERLIDLDILLYGDQQVSSELLTIPHVEIANRDFVLIPLADISPGLVIPTKGSVESLISHLSETYLKPLN